MEDERDVIPLFHASFWATVAPDVNLINTDKNYIKVFQENHILMPYQYDR